MPRVPKYRHHAHTARAVVTLGGKDIYLGRYNSPESRELYDRLVAEWLANGRKPPIRPGPGLTVVELCAAYFRHAQTYYRKRDGTPTTSMHRVRRAIKLLKKLYGSLPVIEFGPLALQAVRQVWIDEGLSRGTVNDYTTQVKMIFGWGVSQELVPETIHRALLTVPMLTAGRTEAIDHEPVRPVPESDIAAIKPHVSRQVWALIQLQLLTGARGGELLPLRPIDFDTSGKVWLVRPAHHKTAHHGRERLICFGPQAQEVVRPFLSGRGVTDYLFSPREAHAELRARAAKVRRRPNQKPTPRETERTIGDHYTPGSYRLAVSRGCDKAFPHPTLSEIEPQKLTKAQRKELAKWREDHRWHPHQLRHNAGTRFRREAGLEHAQVVLGLADGRTTAIYALRDEQKAIELMARIG